MTYQNPTPGKELGYAEATAAQTGVGTTITNLTSLSVTVTVGSKPVWVSAFVGWQKKTSASYVDVEIYDDTAAAVKLVNSYSAGTDEYGTHAMRVRVNPGAGTRTYRLRGRAGAGTVDFNAGATYPNHIAVAEANT